MTIRPFIFLLCGLLTAVASCKKKETTPTPAPASTTGQLEGFVPGHGMRVLYNNGLHDTGRQYVFYYEHLTEDAGVIHWMGNGQYGPGWNKTPYRGSIDAATGATVAAPWYWVQTWQDQTGYRSYGMQPGANKAFASYLQNYRAYLHGDFELNFLPTNGTLPADYAYVAANGAAVSDAPVFNNGSACEVGGYVYQNGQLTAHLYTSTIANDSARTIVPKKNMLTASGVAAFGSAGHSLLFYMKPGWAYIFRTDDGTTDSFAHAAFAGKQYAPYQGTPAQLVTEGFRTLIRQSADGKRLIICTWGTQEHIQPPATTGEEEPVVNMMVYDLTTRQMTVKFQNAALPRVADLHFSREAGNPAFDDQGHVLYLAGVPGTNPDIQSQTLYRFDGHTETALAGGFVADRELPKLFILGNRPIVVHRHGLLDLE